MTVVGFNFTKINVEKVKPLVGKVSINNNIAIQDVETKDLALGKLKQSGLKVAFEYGVNYATETKDVLAKIDLEGDVLLLEEEATVKKVLDSWKKDKKLTKELTLQVLNTALGKCNLQSMILSRDMNLPSPIPLPKIETGDQPPV